MVKRIESKKDNMKQNDINITTEMIKSFQIGKAQDQMEFRITG